MCANTKIKNRFLWFLSTVEKRMTQLEKRVICVNF
jgi:hypothetical protein